jgi:hypothetical protein
MASISDIYSLAHERILNSAHRSPSDEKYSQHEEYGPYHSQYWSMAGDNLDQGMPISSNGGYQSAYGTAGLDAYLPGVTVSGLGEQYGEMSQSNGYDHPNGSIYTFGRNAQDPYSSQPSSATMYPSPVEKWNYPLPVDLNTQLLSSLDSLSTQILNVVLSGTISDAMTAVSQIGTPGGQAFSNLESMFESIASQFPHDDASHFLRVDKTLINTHVLAATSRKANLAKFALSLFKARDVPFMSLDANFLDIFMPAGMPLLLNEGSLFLELKTQAFMAMSMGQSGPKAYLDQLFPRDLQLIIMRRRAESHHLAATEQDFISRYNARRQHLASCCDDLVALSQLPARYSWSSLLTELRACVNRNLEHLESLRTSTVRDDTHGDAIAKAALAAHAAISRPQRKDTGLYNLPMLQTTSFVDTHSRQRSFAGSDSSLSPISPSEPSYLQYRTHRYPGSKSRSPRLRLSASAQPNARRQWTSEEERALMDGLERVKGPHWSQILALYGSGGSLGEVLGGRNQVQLKDKARNMKLFFLKSGVEVPEYLKKVTGELKTRAPAQAAKLEAREKLRRLEESAKSTGRDSANFAI